MAGAQRTHVLWGSDEQDLPHYDDLLLPDNERISTFATPATSCPATGSTIDAGAPGSAQPPRDPEIHRPHERRGPDDAYRHSAGGNAQAGIWHEPGRRGEPSRVHGESRHPGADPRHADVGMG
ncbi:MAG: hypothetical protein VB137_01155 [Burkholderia sp.]